MQHLDEGTIHAWLDGALSPNEASAAEAHVQSCAQCAAAVAEARGLIAASSRILGALDDVPAVQESPRMPWQPVAARRRSGWWWRRAGIGYAAAATILLAAGTTLVLRSASPDMAMDRATPAADQTAQLIESSRNQPVRDGAAASRGTVSGSSTVPVAVPRAVIAGEQDSARRVKAVAEPQAKKEELAIDRIVPLSGAMPRPMAPAAAPPPSVRQDEHKAAVADMAANVAPARGALVQGRVLDAATGAPVVGANVSIDSARVVASTDSAGKFKLQAVPLGQQTVSVRALGFQGVRRPVAVAAKDSVDLAFALQRATPELQSVVVTGAQAQGQRLQERDMQGARRDAQRDQAANAREGQRQDSLVKQAQVAAPILRLEDVRANAANVLGCYTLRVVADKERDADRAMSASLPSRLQLEAAPVMRARANEALVNRARTLEGTGRAESWRFVGDSLELSWTDGTRRNMLRFARRDGRWISDLAVMEPCVAR